VLGLTALLGGAGMATAGAAVGTAIGSVHRVSVGAGQLTVAGLSFSYPALNAAAVLILALAALGAVTLAGVVRAGWRQRCDHRRFLTKVQVLGALDEHPGVIVIAGDRPEAFCAGFLRPTVYISTGAVDALAPDELRAVLAHERHHQRARDPLSIACGRVLAHAVFFVPVLRPLRDTFADLAEVRADRAAVRASAGRPRALASALLVFDAARPGTGGVSAARVDSLLGEPGSWHVSRRLLFASLVVLAAMGVAIWRAGAGASARATLDLPLFSSTPCVSLLLIASVLLCAGAVRLHPRRATVRRSRRYYVT
jgi:hypothetical protein